MNKDLEALELEYADVLTARYVPDDVFTDESKKSKFLDDEAKRTRRLNEYMERRAALVEAHKIMDEALHMAYDLLERKSKA